MNKFLVFNDEQFKDDSTQDTQVEAKVENQLVEMQVKKFDIDEFKSNYSEFEWRVILNNMRKREVISQDPLENSKIKFIRAQN